MAESVMTYLVKQKHIENQLMKQNQLKILNRANKGAYNKYYDQDINEIKVWLKNCGLL